MSRLIIEKCQKHEDTTNFCARCPFVRKVKKVEAKPTKYRQKRSLDGLRLTNPIREDEIIF